MEPTGINPLPQAVPNLAPVAPVYPPIPAQVPLPKRSHKLLWTILLLFILGIFLGGFLAVRYVVNLAKSYLPQNLFPKTETNTTLPQKISTGPEDFTSAPVLFGDTCLSVLGVGLRLPADFSLVYEDGDRAILSGATSQIYILHGKDFKNGAITVGSTVDEKISFEGKKDNIGLLVLVDAKKIDTPVDTLKIAITSMFDTLHLCEK